MANAYSSPLNFQDTIDITDVAKYSGAVQGQMQKKFDINLAKIEDLAGQIANAPLVREKDKQYLGNRLHQMLQSVDKNAKLNLTDNTAVSQINSYISGAIDENVKKQISNSLKISQFNNEITTLKTKEPKLYNDSNVAYAYHKSGLNNYMSGESDDLGNLSYTPYVDKSKVLDELKKIKELKGDQVVEVPMTDGLGNATGRIKKTSISGLSESEIYQYMPQLLSSDILNQIKIDGWAKYKDNIPQAQADFAKYSASKIGALEDDIKESQAKLDNNSLNPEQRKEAEANLKNKKLEKIDTEGFLKNVNINDPEQLGFFLEKGAYQYSLAKIASGRVSTSFETDDYFFERQKLDLAIDKDSRDREEHALDMQLKGAELLGKTNKLNAQNGIASNNTDAYAIGERATTNQPENPNFLADANKSYTDNYKATVANIWKVYNGDNTSEEQKKQFIATLNKKGFGFSNGNLYRIKGKEDINKNYSILSTAVEAFSASNMNTGYAKQSADILMGEVKAIAMAKILADVNKDSFGEKFNSNPQKYINQLKYAEEYSKKGALVAGHLAENQMVNYGENKELRKANNEINKFVADNGGWQGIYKNIGKSPSKIREMAELINKAKTGIPNFLGESLYDEGIKKSNELLVEKNRTGSGAFLVNQKQFNITSEEERKNLINLMPQDGQMSSLFDEKIGMVAWKNTDNTITLKQSKGWTNPEKGGGTPEEKTPAVQVIQPGSAQYNYLNSKIELTSDKDAVDARTVKGMEIKPNSKPAFISKGYTDINNKADAAMLGINPSIIKGFNAPPANYLNETRARDKFKQVLKDRMPEADLTYLLDNLGRVVGDFELTVKPMDGVWGAEVFNKTDKTLKIGAGKFTETSSFLDRDVLELTKNYPQVIIMDKLLGYLYKHPEEVRNVIKP